MRYERWSVEDIAIISSSDSYNKHKFVFPLKNLAVNVHGKLKIKAQKFFFFVKNQITLIMINTEQKKNINSLNVFIKNSIIKL